MGLKEFLKSKKERKQLQGLLAEGKFPLYRIDVSFETQPREEHLENLKKYSGKFLVLSDGRVVRNTFNRTFSCLREYTPDLGIDVCGMPAHLHFPPSNPQGTFAIDWFSERDGKLYLDTVRQDANIPSLREDFEPHYLFK